MRGWTAISARVAWGCFGAASLAAVVLIAVTASGTTFTGDEWGILFRLADRPLPDAVLDPPAGKYLLVVPMLIYAALAELFGMDSYVPYRVVGLVLLVLAAGLFLELARRRVGHPLALGGAILLLFFGAALEVVAIPARLPSQVAICAGLGMLIALDRRGRCGDVAACALGTVAVTSHPIGLAFLAAGVARIGMDDPGRRWSRSWVALVPLALYALWYATLRDPIEGLRATFSDTVSFAWSGFVALCGALTGVFRTPWTVEVDFINPWSTLVAIAVLVIGLVAIARTRRITPGLVAVLVALAVDLIAPALAPGGLDQRGEPDAPRYLYPGAIFMLLVATELRAGRRLGVRFRLMALGFTALVFLSAMYSNIAYLVDRTDSLASNAEVLRTELGALELARERDRRRLAAPLPTAEGSVTVLSFVAAGTRPAAPGPLVQAAPAYFTIADEFGSPASTRSELERASPALRERADLVLATAFAVNLEPAARAPRVGDAPFVERAFDARPRERGPCLTLRPDRGSPAEEVTAPPAPGGDDPPPLAELSVPPGRLWIGTRKPDGSALRLGRVADKPTYPIRWEAREERGILSLPRGGLGEMHWRLLVYSHGETTVCT